MDKLSKEAAAARAMGLSYGQYKAQQYLQEQNKPPKINPPKKPQKKRQKHYTDPEVFNLWQQGKTDTEIASVFGVSRAIIQRWRDVMELPSTSKKTVETKKYRLVSDERGRFYAIKSDTTD